MNTEDARRLLVVCHGYWPASAPGDDPLTLAAWVDLLEPIPFDDAVKACRNLAKTGRDFCPTPGAIYAEAIRPEPPERKPFAPELPSAPEDLSDVPALLAEARSRLHAATTPLPETDRSDGSNEK